MIPQWIQHLKNTLVLGMETDKSGKWSDDFTKAVDGKTNLDSIKGPFLVIVLESALTTFDHAKFPNVKKSIDDVIKLCRDGSSGDEFRSAAEAAYAAAYAAAEAAADAAYAAAHVAAYAAAASNKSRQSQYAHFADELLRLVWGLNDNK